MSQADPSRVTVMSAARVKSRRGRTLTHHKSVRLFPASVRRTPLTLEGTSGVGVTLGTLVPQDYPEDAEDASDAPAPRSDIHYWHGLVDETKAQTLTGWGGFASAGSVMASAHRW